MSAGYSYDDRHNSCVSHTVQLVVQLLTDISGSVSHTVQLVVQLLTDTSGSVCPIQCS